ncbi:hypothetical protein ACFW6Q_19555 [Streptomyces sp. NPDC058737]|uniref:hypothetical protein n=1 Tax=Streptomyces sp. NPDC058737 TaxID=3346617 RepID=UPI0036A1893A
MGQASLADQAVFGQYRGRVHLSVLLLRLDLATGEVEATDAGTPRLWRLRDGGDRYEERSLPRARGNAAAAARSGARSRAA